MSGPSVAGPFSGLRYVGQVGKCFLVCEAADSLVIIDQHAAHERVLFEQFVAGTQPGALRTQALLIPMTVALAPEELAVLLEQSELLGHLGFDLEASGPRMVRVRSQPAILTRDLAQEVRALAASLLQGGRGQATQERLERVAATLACHAAVRAGDAMNPEAVQGLLLAMDHVDLAAYCPHGRPAVMRSRWEDLGKWFART